jgi:hypothetical protein
VGRQSQARKESFLPSLVSHAIAALGIGTIFARPEIPKRVWAIGAAGSIDPRASAGVSAGFAQIKKCDRGVKTLPLGMQ